jgi:hypothetical protein
MTVQNLVAVYGQATRYEQAQAAWYWQARADCIKAAQVCKIPLKRFVYAVAALSPAVKWERNVEAALELALTGYTGYGYKVNRVKAWECLQGNFEALKGPKVTRFAQSILNPARYSREVVIDRWAIRAWSGTMGEVKTLTLKQYHGIASDYREAARLAGLLPGEFQAVVWTVIRRIGNHPAQIALDI